MASTLPGRLSLVGRRRLSPVRKGEEKAYRFIGKALDKSFRFQGATNAQYSGRSVREVILFAAMTRRTLESAVLILKDRGKRVPSPDVVFNRIRETRGRDLVAFFKPCLETVFKTAKKGRLFVGRKRVAVDIHEKPFYGQEAEGTVRGRARRGTTRFWAYITLDVLHEGCRYTLASLPLTDKKKAPDLVEALLRYARGWIRIDMVLLDRFFYNSRVIQVLEGMGLDWLMAARATGKLRREAEEALEGGLPRFRYTMNQGMESQITFYAFTVPAGEGYHYFATNREVRYLRYWAGVYRRRWGIDTGYRVKKGFLAKTAARDHHVRLFTFLLSILLQNVWELLGRGEDGVTADLFRDRCERLIMGGLPPRALQGFLLGMPS